MKIQESLRGANPFIWASELVPWCRWCESPPLFHTATLHGETRGNKGFSISDGWDETCRCWCYCFTQVIKVFLLPGLKSLTDIEFTLALYSLTSISFQGKKWRKLWDRNEASSKGKAATSVACTSTKLRRVNFKGSEASFLQQLDEANVTHISTDMVFLTPELRKHLSCI